jgi:5-methylcytosine-specific restriction endonuclease McrA
MAMPFNRTMLSHTEAKELLTAYLRTVGRIKPGVKLQSITLAHWASKHFGASFPLVGKGAGKRAVQHYAALVPPQFLESRKSKTAPALRLAAVNGATVSLKQSARKVLDRRRSQAEAQEFYASWEWLKLRRVVLERDGFRCADCGATKDHPGVRLVVDHVFPLRAHWHLRLAPTNLRTRCDECNRGKSDLTLDQLARQARLMDVG